MLQSDQPRFINVCTADKRIYTSTVIDGAVRLSISKRMINTKIRAK